MVHPDRIINYLKPRITNVVQHNHVVSSDMSSTTINMIYLNLKYDHVYYIIIDNTEYNFHEYINDRFGTDYNREQLEQLDHFINELYYSNKELPIKIDYTYD